MTLPFVQGDTGPDIEATLHDLDDSSVVFNLTGATVKFQMRKPDDRRFTVNAMADVIVATAGQVSYTWGPNDLATPGTYDVQWEVTFSSGQIQTTAYPTEIIVRRQ
jgi:hypothetical protein